MKLMSTIQHTATGIMNGTSCCKCSSDAVCVTLFVDMQKQTGATDCGLPFPMQRQFHLMEILPRHAITEDLLAQASS